MITKITSTGFKGLNFSYALKQRNLIVGSMGIGKSSISEAGILVTTGYIPGAGKTNQAIMDSFAGDDKLFVSVELSGLSFERQFVRNSKGKVSQKYRVNGNNKSKEDFTSEFAVAGKPTIIDLQAFLELSDQKKIDTVFDLYPPIGDVGSLSDEIEKVSGKLNELRAAVSKKEGSVEGLIKDRAERELPAGTLAEVTQDIERTTAEVKLARKNLSDQKIRDAAQEAKEKAEAKAKKDAEANKELVEKEAKEKAEAEVMERVDPTRPTHGFKPDLTARNGEDFQSQPEYGTREYAGEMIAGSEGSQPVKKGVYLSDTDMAESIKIIIATMEKAGCTSCAARLVAKRELRKY